MMKRRIQFWPYLPASLAGALLSELVRGLALVFEPGQLFVNGQPMSKFEFLFQNLGSLLRGTAILGIPFGLVAWPILSLCIPRDRWWRHVPIIFLLVIAWNAVMTPIDYMLPELLVWIGPYLVFVAGVVCTNAVRRLWPLADRSFDPSTLLQQRPEGQPLNQITKDIRCAQCGYNLRTLNIDAQCPECGMSIDETLRRLAWKPRTHSIWKFLPISIGFAVLVAAAHLIATDLAWRFRSSYPLHEGLWGNKWLVLVLYGTAVVYGISALAAWPLFWLALRRKRLWPSLAFIYIAVTLTVIVSPQLESVPYVPYVVLLVALAICGWSGYFDFHHESRVVRREIEI